MMCSQWSSAKPFVLWLGAAVGWLLLTCSAWCQRPDVAGPKYGLTAQRLSRERAFLRTDAAPDFWTLIPYYVGQADDQSCSAAAVAMIVNAARAGRELNADEPLATTESVVDRVAHTRWREKLVAGGPGVSLDELAVLLDGVLRAYHVPAFTLEVHRFEGPADVARCRLHALLVRNEMSDRDWVIANFLQSKLTGDPEGAVGHMAPIAAYDARRRRALVLDPDRHWYEPYWVPLTTLWEGLAAPDAVTGRSRGLIRVILSRSDP